ncbi:MAG TPA: tetratricopeptide repeat protein [Gemmatimonadaceae bacterium]|nr:tetratricopeptide repeat protein [Gemmatimonadaceae bacterium]
MPRSAFLLISAASALIVAPRVSAQCSTTVQKQISDHAYDAALAELEPQLKARPDNDVLIDCMGRILLARGKSGKAVDWLEKAVKLNPRNAYHHEGLGKALMEEGGKASIIRRPFLIRRFKTEFETAVALEPTLVDSRRVLVMLYAMAPGALGGSMPKAKEQADAIMKLNPMRGHTALGFVAERNKDIPGAEKEFLAAIALHPDSVAPYVATGAFYHRQKRVTDSISMYQKALALDPKNEDVKKELASLSREGK